MEISGVEDDIKIYDETASFIYNSVSSHDAPGSLKETYGDDVDSKEWIVKTEPASPVRDTTEAVKSPGSLEETCEVDIDNKEGIVKTEPVSPVWDTSDEENNQGLPQDSKEWLVKTEPASPVWDASDADKIPGSLKETYEVDVDCKEWLIKTEPASPVRNTSDADNNPVKKTAMNGRKGNNQCCVVNCRNTCGTTEKSVSFYRFPGRPHEKELKIKWIFAVNRKNPDGSLWQPADHSRICSCHFVGGKRSHHPLSPSYVPSIFPTIYKRRANPESSDGRHSRYNKRALLKPSSSASVLTSVPPPRRAPIFVRRKRQVK